MTRKDYIKMAEVIRQERRHINVGRVARKAIREGRTMADRIDNSQDVIDSRDVIARIQELEENLRAAEEAYKNDEITEGDYRAQYDNEGAELDALRKLEFMEACFK